MTKRSFIKLFFLGVFAPILAITFFARNFWRPLLKTSYLEGNYQSDHFDGERFFNLFYQTPAKTLKEVLEWRLNAKLGPWPEHVAITPDTPPERVEGKSLRVSFVGHATVLVQTTGVNILFDPIWDDRAGPISFLGPRRVSEPGIRITDLPKIDYIPITHNHYDHLSLRTLTSLLKDQLDRFSHRPTIITPLGNAKIISTISLTTSIEEGDWYDTFMLTKNSKKLELVIEPTQHWSRRGAFDFNRCLWCAFVLRSPYGNIYFAGDTGWGQGENFHNTIKRYGAFRFAMIPIGAYEPRDFMKPQHINPQEAVQVAEILKPDLAMAIHFQTYKGLTDEGYDDPVTELALALKQSVFPQEHFKVLKAGEYLLL